MMEQLEYQMEPRRPGSPPGPRGRADDRGRREGPGGASGAAARRSANHPARTNAMIGKPGELRMLALAAALGLLPAPRAQAQVGFVGGVPYGYGGYGTYGAVSGFGLNPFGAVGAYGVPYA